MWVWGDAVVGLRSPVPQVQEIVFRNFYTAFLSVRVQRPGPGGSRRWMTCLRDLCLMPCPHTEEGSQDYFCLHRHQVSMSGWDRGVTSLWCSPLSAHTPGWLPLQGSGAHVPLTPMAARVPVPHSAQPALTARCLPWTSSIWGGLGVLGGYPKSCPQSVPAPVVTLPVPSLQMLCDLDQVTAMRFILRQPSPVWLHFTIEDLQIFPPGQKVSRCQSYPTARHEQGARTSHCPQLYTWHFPLQL